MLWVARLKAKYEAGRSSFFLLSLYAFLFKRCSGDAGRRPSVQQARNIEDADLRPGC